MEKKNHTLVPTNANNHFTRDIIDTDALSAHDLSFRGQKHSFDDP